MARLVRASALAPGLIAVTLSAACGRGSAPEVALVFRSAAGEQYGELWTAWLAREAPGVRVSIWLDAARIEERDLARAVARAESLAQRRDLVAVVELGPSRQALAAAPILRQAGIPYLLPASTSNDLARMGPPILPLSGSDSLQGEAIAQLAAQDLDGHRIVLFYHTSEYGRDLYGYTTGALERRGRPPALAQSFDDASDLQVFADLAVQGEPPDVVIVLGYDAAVGRLTALFGARAPRAQIVASDGALAAFSNLLAQAGARADSVWIVAPDIPDTASAAYRAFHEAFVAVLGREPVGHDVLFHDALALVVRAVRGGGRTAALRRAVLALDPSTVPTLALRGERTAPFAVLRLQRGVLGRATPGRRP